MEPTAPTIGPLKALRSFGCYMHNGEYQSFNEGTVIVDEIMCRYLLDVKCPVVPINEFDVCACPHCHSLLKRTENPINVFIAKAPCRFNHDVTFYNIAQNNIIPPYILDVVKGFKLPMEEIIGVECPRCKFLFY